MSACVGGCVRVCAGGGAQVCVSIQLFMSREQKRTKHKCRREGVEEKERVDKKKIASSTALRYLQSHIQLKP